MEKQFSFYKIIDTGKLENFKVEWRKSLTAPQDGMWEILTNYAHHWELKNGNESIGYACIDEDKRLLQFFVLPTWLQEGQVIFKQFIDQHKINRGLIGTNNPVFLSIGMHFQKSLKVHTYLFADFLRVEVSSNKGALQSAEKSDLEKLIDFCHESTGGPKGWLSEYLGDLIAKGELFFLSEDGEILGTCEVRKSETNLEFADLGMIVSTKHRKKGLGTYLLGKGKEIAYKWEKKPICSCEKDNIGSLRAIQKNGFRSIHQMLLVGFE